MTVVNVGAPLEDMFGARVTALGWEFGISARAREWLYIRTLQLRERILGSPYRLDMSSRGGKVKCPTRV